MIKQDIVDNVANATGLTKVEVEAVLNESFGEIIRALSNNEKIELRNKARANKNYKEADRIRDDLLDKGVLIEDKDGKTLWKFK